MSLSCTVFDTRYWSKIADLNLPHLYLVHALGVTHRNFAEIFRIKNLETLGYCMALFA